MTKTIEKALEEILDQKRHVIEQAKVQSESFSRYLASKLLIQGISPPSTWLQNPPSTSSDPIGFKKEQLLSELLLPHVRTTNTSTGGVCSLIGGNYVSNECYDLEHGPEFVSNINNKEINSVLNAPEQDVSTSLQGKSVVGTSDIIAEPANEETSKGFSFETLVPNGNFNTENKSTPHPELKHKDVWSTLAFAPELDQSLISPKGKNETRISSNTTSREQSLSRIQRSKSRQKALELRKTAEKAGKTHQNDANASAVCNSGNNIINDNSNQQQPHIEGKPFASTKNFEIQSHMHAEAKDGNTGSGRIARSRSPISLFTDDNKSKLDNELDIVEVNSDRTIKPHNNCVEGVPKNVHLSNASSHRVTRSKSGLSGKLPLNNSNSHEESQNNYNIGDEEKTDRITGDEVILDGHAELQAPCSRSKLDNAGPSAELKRFVLKTSSDCTMYVEPKSLVFDEMEKNTLVEVISLSEKMDTLNESEKRRESAESHISLGKVACSNCSRKSLEKQFLGEDIRNQTTESCKDTFETCLEKHIVDDEQIILPRTGNNLEGNSDVDGKTHKSPIPRWERNKPSNAGEKNVDQLMYRKEEETNSTSNQQVLECELSCNQMVKANVTPSSKFIDDLEICQVSSSRQPEADNGNIFNFDELRELKIREEPSIKGSKPRFAAEYTWPQIKRRKTESQETNSIPAGSRFNYRNLNSNEPNLGIALVIESSLSSHEENAAQSSTSKIPHEKLHPNISFKERESLEMPTEQCELSCNQMVRANATPVSNFIENSIVCQICSPRELEANNGTILNSDEIEELKILEESSVQGRNLRSVVENTWPQLKRRKIESLRANSIPAGISFRARENHNLTQRWDYRNLNSIGPSLGTALQFESSPSSHEENVAQSSVSKSSLAELNPRILAEEPESFPEMPIEQCERASATIISSFIDDSNPCQVYSSGQPEANSGNIFKSDEIKKLKILKESSMEGRKFRCTAEYTWPQFKRGNIKSQEINSVPAGISFKVRENHGTGKRSNCRSLNSAGPNLGTALQFENSPSSHEENASQSFPSETPDVELHPNTLVEEREFLAEMPIEQDELEFGAGPCKRSAINVQDGESTSFTASGLSKGDAEDSKTSFFFNAKRVDATTTVLMESTQVVENDNKNLVNLKNDYLTENKDDVRIPYAVEDGSSDRTMPEFEGFIIGEEDSGQRHIVNDAFDYLDLPTTSVERASVLEQLCKSAVMHTPLYCFSAKHKIQRTPDIYHSVPTAKLNDVEIKKLGTSFGSVDKLPISDAYYGERLTIPPSSPEPKSWGSISSQSFSSEKRLSSNAELTCFPIEEDEDPSISEGQEDKDEVANSTQEEICSDERNPLADITQENIDPPLSVYAAKKSRDMSSKNSVATEINFTGTHGGVKQKLGKRISNNKIGTHEAKKKLTLSTSTKFLGNAKESLNNIHGKPEFSRKTSLRNGGLLVSGRESQHTNIISNISSFIPLVQQKQAAAVITGKRDVKVKALEAAEAAKRLEEKKENERKLKKEALKLERAKQEQKNLRQAELKRKKKEDEIIKKEADVAARKRQREEEEKKKREKKRRRFEGKRQQQKQQEEKMRARKLEKEIPDAKLKSQRLKFDMDKGGENYVKKPDTESLLPNRLENDVREAAIQGFEAFSHSRVSGEVSNTTRGKSYEVSPYNSSDGEDDEDNEVSPRKFVPTWASKKALALVVSLQKDIDPDILFYPESFSSVDEVAGLGDYKKK